MTTLNSFILICLSLLLAALSFTFKPYTVEYDYYEPLGYARITAVNDDGTYQYGGEATASYPTEQKITVMVADTDAIPDRLPDTATLRDVREDSGLQALLLSISALPAIVGLLYRKPR